MKNGLWIVVVVVALFVGFLLGYTVSGYTIKAAEDDDDDDARIDRSSRYTMSSSYKSSYKRMS